MLEILQKDGELYPPQTLHCIVRGLMRHVCKLQPAWHFLKDPVFDSAHRMLNGEMKRLRSIGLGVKTKRAEPISTEEENSLWEQGLLDAKFS